MLDEALRRCFLEAPWALRVPSEGVESGVKLLQLSTVTVNVRSHDRRGRALITQNGTGWKLAMMRPELFLCLLVAFSQTMTTMCHVAAA